MFKLVITIGVSKDRNGFTIDAYRPLKTLRTTLTDITPGFSVIDSIGFYKNTQGVGMTEASQVYTFYVGNDETELINRIKKAFTQYVRDTNQESFVSETTEVNVNFES